MAIKDDYCPSPQSHTQIRARLARWTKRKPALPHHSMQAAAAAQAKKIRLFFSKTTFPFSHYHPLAFLPLFIRFCCSKSRWLENQQALSTHRHTLFAVSTSCLRWLMCHPYFSKPTRRESTFLANLDLDPINFKSKEKKDQDIWWKCYFFERLSTWNECRRV